MFHIDRWPRWTRWTILNEHEKIIRFGVERVLSPSDQEPVVVRTVTCCDSLSLSESESEERLTSCLQEIGEGTEGVLLTNGFDANGTVWKEERIVLSGLSPQTEPETPQWLRKAAEIVRGRSEEDKMEEGNKEEETEEGDKENDVKEEEVMEEGDKEKEEVIEEGDKEKEEVMEEGDKEKEEGVMEEDKDVQEEDIKEENKDVKEEEEEKDVKEEEEKEKDVKTEEVKEEVGTAEKSALGGSLQTVFLIEGKQGGEEVLHGVLTPQILSHLSNQRVTLLSESGKNLLVYKFHNKVYISDTSVDITSWDPDTRSYTCHTENKMNGVKQKIGAMHRRAQKRRDKR